MQHLGGVVKNLNAKQEPEVFLAVTATYPLKPLLDVIRETTDAYPATHIRLSRESMSGPIEQLLHGDADLIVATMDGVPVDQVEAVPFSSVTIIPVAHPEYAPAQNKEMNSIREMQSYVQVVVADSGSGKKPQSRDLLPGGLRWTVSDFAAKKDIILAKMGWGGLPEHLIRDEIDKGELMPLNVEGYPQRQSHLFQMRSRNRDAGIVAQSIWDRLMSFSGQIL
jgi:DNA-binding transcriptional LysR family regulator